MYVPDREASREGYFLRAGAFLRAGLLVFALDFAFALGLDLAGAFLTATLALRTATLALVLALVLALAFTGAAFTFVTRPLSRLKIAAPSSAGERTVVTRAASSAANLSAAVPLPPEITAPA